MIRPLLLAVALLIPSCALAQDSQGLLPDANALYRDGQFAEAVNVYREAFQAGLDGPRVQYNLANALYRSDEPGEAIAHYLAALTMAPRDPDIRANLNRALSQRPAGRPAPPASWFHATASRIVSTFTLSEFAVAAAVCWWVAIAAVVALLIGAGRRRTMRRVAIVLGVLALALGGFAVARWWAWHKLERAVVSVEQAQIRTGPGESFEVALPVQEGWMVRVLRRDADWAEVVGEGGVRGWIPTSALTVVEADVAEAGRPDG